ncbi:hypothetical protein V490_02256 [Pseudogymnoascus sp. VKM F-3557]|nr:hypothetical protein V490_02256 [Pseudogymnoascus sp. VKM F-3557]
MDSVSPSSEAHLSANTNGSDRLYRVPKISRKVHACTECQARKIKCDVNPPERSICTRCSKKQMRCVVNKSLQSLLGEGTEWKTTMEESTQTLSLAVSNILSVLKLPPLESFASQQQYNQPQVQQSVTRSVETTDMSRPFRTSSMAMTRESSQEPAQSRENDTLVTDPMGALYEVTKLRNLRSNNLHRHGNVHATKSTILEDDFISKGKVSEADAKELFSTFSTSLNHYLWGGIALVHEDLVSVRRSSSLLLAAIFTVTALHVPGKEQVFDICYAEFTALVCDSMFDRYHSLDAIRALCIGAFWLSDVSWKLAGHAVRIATELNLHQSYSRAMRGSREHFEGARLWYFIYVCDHHFSIAYGRPPVIHEDATITNHEKFLNLPGISQADFRLHSQVSVFIILTRVYNTFGPEIEQVVAEEDLIRLRQFNHALDSWRLHWEPQLTPNHFIATYPAKGVVLHHHFARLQVSSLSLRGIQQGGMHNLTIDRRDLANTAIASATSILQTVLDEPGIRNSVVGVPIYLHTMIAYSAVFLLKVQQKWKAYNLSTDATLIRDLVMRIIRLLLDARAGERHLSSHIATGLSKMLDHFTSWEAGETSRILPVDAGQISQDNPSNPGAQVWEPNYAISDTGILRMFDTSVPFYDEHYFPLGFFDVMSAGQPDTDYRHRE